MRTKYSDRKIAEDKCSDMKIAEDRCSDGKIADDTCSDRKIAYDGKAIRRSLERERERDREKVHLLQGRLHPHCCLHQQYDWCILHKVYTYHNALCNTRF